MRNACNVNIAGQVRREIPVNQLVSQSIYLSTANERATYESGQGTLLTGNRRRKTTCSRCPRNNTSSKQSNRRLTSPALCTPVTPFPLTGDAAYHQHTGGGPSHGHRHMHKNVVKIARVVPEISSRTDRQTHRQTYSSQYFATAPVGKVINIILECGPMPNVMAAMQNIGVALCSTPQGLADAHY